MLEGQVTAKNLRAFKLAGCGIVDQVDISVAPIGDRTRRPDIPVETDHEGVVGAEVEFPCEHASVSHDSLFLLGVAGELDPVWSDQPGNQHRRPFVLERHPARQGWNDNSTFGFNRVRLDQARRLILQRHLILQVPGFVVITDLNRAGAERSRHHVAVDRGGKDGKVGDRRPGLPEKPVLRPEEKLSDAKGFVHSLPVELHPRHEPAAIAPAQQRVETQPRFLDGPAGVEVFEIVIASRHLREIQVEGMKVLSIVEHTEQAEGTVDSECLLPIRRVDEQTRYIRNVQRVGLHVSRITVGDLFRRRLGRLDVGDLRGFVRHRPGSEQKDQAPSGETACHPHRDPQSSQQR